MIFPLQCRGRSSCEMTSERLSFRSDKCFRGASADRLLVNQLGGPSSFVDQGLKVFRGAVAFRYLDPLCRPIEDVEEQSKWCL